MITKSGLPQSEDMQKINSYTRREFGPEEVYLFQVILCDNEIDRDGECFTKEALEGLATLFLGKTGIFDHNPIGENQKARIFDAVVKTDPKQTTRQGAPYAYLLAKAYMVRCPENEQLILEIEGGIKKEVSVGCSMASLTCSVCGADWRREGCGHEKGHTYDGVLCCGVLEHPTDAYEWSFVAIPAQPKAGVVKHFAPLPDRLEAVRGVDVLCKALGEGSVNLCKEEATLLAGYIEGLKTEASLGQAYRKSVEDNVVRLAFLCEEGISPACRRSVVQKMTLEELLTYQSAYEKKVADMELGRPKLSAMQPKEENQAMQAFKL